MRDKINLEKLKKPKRVNSKAKGGAFERQIAKLEGEIFSERCCQSTTKIYLPIVNKRRIKR